MQFAKLCEYFQRIEAMSLRNNKTTILAEMLKEAEPAEVDKLVYLALGGLRPKFDRLEFNLAEKMIVRAIAASAGKTIQEMTGEYKRVGDLGELAVGNKPLDQLITKPLSILEVYAELERVARDNGVGSQERKVGALTKLIKQVDSQSAKYIVRMVAGKLRLGFSDKTVLDALSYMENGTKDYSELLDRAYQVRPDVGVLAKATKEVGVTLAAKSAQVNIGTPVIPALAQRLKTAKEMIEKMGKVIVEPKYDGTRVAVHFKRSGFEKTEKMTLFGDDKLVQVRTFTRNLDENSAMFPELTQIAGQIKADEVILDSEAVGYDPQSGKLYPFQMTITRKRKHGVETATGKVPLRFFVYDILYKDGETLIHRPLSERRAILAKTVSGAGPLVVDPYIETEDPAVLREYHQTQLAAGLEGALVKQAEGQYMPGRTGWNWVKFKEAEDSRAKLADTLDVVVMGYYRGRGKRTHFGLGAFLVGVREGDRIVTVAKIGTGISDQQFGELYDRLKKIESRIQIPEYVVAKNLTPDVWVEPQVVVEVAADEITKSPVHSAGCALRFPRLVKFREDKDVEQITSRTEVEEMYAMVNP